MRRLDPGILDEKGRPIRQMRLLDAIREAQPSPELTELTQKIISRMINPPVLMGARSPLLDEHGRAVWKDE